MRVPLVCRIFTPVLSLAFLSDIVRAQGTVGIFDVRTDVGRAKSGSASYDPHRQTYLVAGSGQNNTGFATRNNNDHVLSFDGRMMGISHHAVEDSGASIIYTLAATGGTPTRVTAKGPSYLHGWSPDGRWLVYTGIRGDEADVYKIRVTGGDEIRLTSAPGLDDGAEFTPDGAYIYFNSSRSGRMQINVPSWSPNGTRLAFVSNSRMP